MSTVHCLGRKPGCSPWGVRSLGKNHHDMKREGLGVWRDRGRGSEKANLQLINPRPKGPGLKTRSLPGSLGGGSGEQIQPPEAIPLPAPSSL